MGFSENPNLATVKVEAIVPPYLEDAFQNAYPNQIDLIVPAGTKDAYLNPQPYPFEGWAGFKSITEEVAVAGDTFIVDHITYEITSINSNTVIAADYNTAGGPSVNIPSTVNHGPKTYTVTGIAPTAFYENQLTEVTIPNSVTRIGIWAFRKTQTLLQ